jgi:hypothetical protein
MFATIKAWLQGRIEGYLLGKGMTKVVMGVTVFLGGVLTTTLAKPAVMAILTKLHTYGVDAAFQNGVLSLQISVETLVGSVGAGLLALAMNFLFRKKPA